MKLSTFAYQRFLQICSVLFLISSILALSANAFAEGPVSASRLGKVAIGGKDTVAYHHADAIAAHQLSKGKKSYVVRYNGVKWRFATEENADLFKANPDRYKPAYGGFCSNALSLGEGLIGTDGTHWEIFGDKLHLFFAGRGRDRWLDGNYERYNKEAMQAWKEITGLDE